MNSIYQRALGADFNRLHPQIQRRFGFSSANGVGSTAPWRHGRDLERPGRYATSFLYVCGDVAPHHVS